MSNTNGKIIAPVDLVGDVSKVLGVSSGDLGTLCMSNSINMWSKIKPLRIDSPTIHICDDENWKSAPEYSCGIKVEPCSSANEIVQIYSGQRTSCFTYDKPQEGDWFRTLDFDGYYHGAINPFGNGIYVQKTVLVGQQLSIYVKERVVNADSVQLENIEITGTQFGDMYFGASFVGNTSCIHTSSTKLVTYTSEGQRMLNEEMVISTTKTTGGLTPGQYTAYPLISMSQFPGYSMSALTGTFFNIAYTDPFTFNVVYDGYIDEGLSSAERINNNQQIKVRIAGTVLQQQSMTFSGRVYLRKPDGTLSVDPITVRFTADGGTGSVARTTYSEYLYLNGTDIDQNWYIEYEFNFASGEYTYIGRIRIV